MMLNKFTASTLFEYDATSSAQLTLGSGSSQAPSGWMEGIGARWCSDPPQRCWSGCKSVFWLARSRTFAELSWSHSCETSAVCLGSVTFWKMNHHPRSRALWSRFSSRLHPSLSWLLPWWSPGGLLWCWWSFWKVIHWEPLWSGHRVPGHVFRWPASRQLCRNLVSEVCRQFLWPRAWFVLWMISGNRMHLSSILSFMAKAVTTYLHVSC